MLSILGALFTPFHLTPCSFSISSLPSHRFYQLSIFIPISFGDTESEISQVTSGGQRQISKPTQWSHALEPPPESVGSTCLHLWLYLPPQVGDQIAGREISVPGVHFPCPPPPLAPAIHLEFLPLFLSSDYQSSLDFS